MTITFDFEWDNHKDALNVMKHGVSFEDASRVFFDPFRLEVFDQLHSVNEERWKVFGLAEMALLMVSCTARGRVIRIISARKATKNETEVYVNGFNSQNGN